MSLVIGGLFSFRQPITRHKRPLLAGTRPVTPGNEEDNLCCKVIQQWRSFPCFFLLFSGLLQKNNLSDSIAFLNSVFQTHNKPIFTTKMSIKNCVTGNVFSYRSRDLLYKQFPKNNQKSASRVTILKRDHAIKNDRNRHLPSFVFTL